MAKFFQVLFAGFVIFSATSAMAAGPCVHLHNQFQCNNYPTGECFWDVADQRCENRGNSEDSCSRIYSRYSCINSYLGCFWDEDDQRCERR